MKAKCFIKLLSLVISKSECILSIITTNESERPILFSLQTPTPDIFLLNAYLAMEILILIALVQLADFQGI